MQAFDRGLRLLASLALMFLLGAGAALAQGVYPAPEAAPDLRFKVAGSVNAIVSFVDGGERYYVIGGNFDRVGGEERSNLALLDTDGNLLAADFAGGTNAQVLALAVWNGKLYVGGQFTAAGGAARARLARFSLPDASLDADFSTGADDVVRALAVDGLGHLYVGGSFANIQNGGSTARERTAKLDATTGAVVAGWNPGYASANVVFALHYDTNGSGNVADHRLYAGGTLQAGGPGQQRAIARLLATTGARDTGWNANVRPAGGASVRAIATDASFVYFGGLIKGVDANNNRANIARVAKSNGALSAWNPGADALVNALRITADGRLLVGGEFLAIGGQAKRRLAKVRTVTEGADPAGSVVAGFTANANRGVASLHQDDLGRALAGGTFSTINADAAGGIARLDPTSGSADAAFVGSAGGPGTVRSVARDALGGFIIGGSFDFVAEPGDPVGEARANLVRLHPDFSIDLGWNTGTTGDVLAVSVAGDQLYLGGRFDSVLATPRTRLARLALDPVTAAPSLDAGWTPSADSDVRLLAADATGVYLAGDFSLINGSVRNQAARIGSAGALSGWNPDPDGRVEALLPVPGAVYLGGSFLNVNTNVPRAGLARVNDSTGALDAFDVQANSTVGALAIRDGHLYVGGAFDSIDGQAIRSLARVDLATEQVDAGWTPWSPTAIGFVRALAHDAAGLLYVGGNFTQAGGLARSNLARVGALGTIDLGWRPGTDLEVRQLAVLDSGNVLAAGDFASVTGAARGGIAQIGTAVSDATAISIDAIVPAGGAGGEPSVVGQAYTVHWSLQNLSQPSELPLGSVTVSASTGEACAPVPAAASGSCELVGASAGPRSIVAAFAGEPEYLDALDTAAHQVDAAAISFGLQTTPYPSELNQEVIAEVTGLAVQAPGGGTPQGSFVVTIDGGPGCTVVLPALGCSLGEFASFGYYEIEASYVDANAPASYVAEAAASTLHAVGTPTSLSLSVPASAVIGTPVVAAVSTTGIPDGQVVDVAGGLGCSIEIENDAGSCLLTFDAAGDIDVLASYAGTGALLPASDSAVVAVSRITTSIALDVDDTTPVIGQAVTFSVITSGIPDGAVLAVSNAPGCASITVTADAGSCEASFAATGAVTVTASFAETAEREASSDALEVTVGRIPTSIALSASNEAPVVGETVTFSVATSNIPDGAVLAVSNAPGCASITVTADAGSCEASFAAAGAVTVTASFAETAEREASSDAVEVTVGRIPTSVALTASNESPVVGETVTFSVATSNIPDGAVLAVSNAPGCASITVTADAGSCEASFAAAGAVTVTASFAETAEREASSDAVEVTVGRIPTSVALTASNEAPVVGETVTFSVATSNIPDGAVLAVSNAPGCASITVTADAGSCEASFAATGAVTVTASFAETAEREASSDAVEVTVGRIPTSIALTASNEAPVVGETVTFSVATSNIPDGAVLAVSNAPGCASITVTADAGSCEASFAAAGAVTVTASFAETAEREAAQDSAGLDVAKGGTSLSLAADPTVIVEGQSVSFSWSLEAIAPANGTPSGSIGVDDGNGLSCSAPVAAGGCSIQIDLQGDYLFSASYAGDDDFTGSVSAVVGVTVNAAVIPPTDADLSVRMQVEGSAYFVADDIELVQFVVEIDNLGPADVLDADFAASLDPAAFEDLSWTCAPAAACSAESGDGDPILQISLGDGESAAVRLLAVVRADAVAPAGGQASIAVPDGLDDPEPGNNSASASYQTCRFSVVEGSAPDPLVLPQHLCHFRDGFED